MKPNNFYGMTIADFEAEERWRHRLKVVAYVGVFITGFIFGLFASTWTYPVFPRWLGW
jgi:hypothetical protein